MKINESLHCFTKNLHIKPNMSKSGINSCQVFISQGTCQSVFIESKFPTALKIRFYLLWRKHSTWSIYFTVPVERDCPVGLSSLLLPTQLSPPLVHVLLNNGGVDLPHGCPYWHKQMFPKYLQPLLCAMLLQDMLVNNTELERRKGENSPHIGTTLNPQHTLTQSPRLHTHTHVYTTAHYKVQINLVASAPRNSFRSQNGAKSIAPSIVLNIIENRQRNKNQLPIWA